jgi:hypothetical protein
LEPNLKDATILFQQASCTLSDLLRGMETRVYRISNASQEAAAVLPDVDHSTALPAVHHLAAAKLAVLPANLVYNPSYEISVNSAVPDGNYVGRHTTCAADEAATFFADSRFSVEGRQSLRLGTPTDNAGLELAPYYLGTLTPSSKYNFSVWIRGAVGDEAVVFSFNTNVFATPPALSNGTLVLAAATSWQQHSVVLTTTAKPEIPNFIPWMTYTLATAGTVWLDVLSITRLPVACAVHTAPLPPCPPPAPTNRTYVGQISDSIGYCKNCTLTVVVSNCTSYWKWVWDYDGSGTKHVPVTLECGWYEQHGVITAPSRRDKPYYWFCGTQHQFETPKSSMADAVLTGSLLTPNDVAEGSWILRAL